MSVSADIGLFGPGGGISRFDSYHTQGIRSGIRYPSPFFDIGHTYMPTSIKQMFRWTRYYFLTHAVISAVSYKMAEYPVTDIVIDEEDSDIKEKWKNIVDLQLKLKPFLIEVGLDYFVYGNAFVTLFFPFHKWLICRNCGHKENVKNADYKFRNLQFHLHCPKCGTTTEAKVRDENYKSLKGIRLLRWSPENISIEHNQTTGETTYFYDMPMQTRNDLQMGKRHIIETTPHIFLSALRENKTLRLRNDSIFHFKRPTIAERDMGWGMPALLPVLKDAYYLQILRKAQEAIANGYIVPLRVLFPQAGGATSDPYTTTDLGAWRRRIERELEKWRLDPNYIPILPLPIGNEIIGGEAKSLMLHQEMRAWTEHIIGGLLVPIEFFYGGLSYSGSNMSIRMLENHFTTQRTDSLILVRDFILGRIADFMGWKKPKAKFKRLKLADDLQRMSLTTQLNQMQKVSDTTMLDEFDYDMDQEERYKKAEMDKQMDSQRKLQLSQAAIMGEVQEIQAKYQAKVQKMMQALAAEQGAAEAGMAPPGPPVPPEAMQQQAEQSAGMAAQGSQQPQMGQEAAPGMPEGATVYPENAGPVPGSGIPAGMVSPELANQQQGGNSLLYLAKRAANYLQKLDETSKYVELMKLKVNPPLYSLVLQILESKKGSQENPLDPMQMPMPEVKPPRREGMS